VENNENLTSAVRVKFNTLRAAWFPLFWRTPSITAWQVTRRQTFVPIVHRFFEVLPLQFNRVHFRNNIFGRKKTYKPLTFGPQLLNLLTSVYWTVVLHDDLVRQSLGFLGFLLHHLDVRFAIDQHPDNQTVNKTD